jgi:SAM-dependent methyltransferase
VKPTPVADLFEQLQRINRPPELYACRTIEELWTDPHISEQMLRYHLDPSVDAASRSAEFIELSVAWLVEWFALGKGRRVVDLGCGPGLYANALARSGAAVTGVDFSSRSIAYAREVAEREGLPTRYVHANYIGWSPEDRFDLALLIYRDYGAMAPDDRRTLLGRVRTMLEPGGAFVLDLASLVMLANEEEASAYAPELMSGFWSSEPYFGFLNTFVYPQARVSLDRYEIVESDRTRTFCNWTQYYDPDSLADELAAGGFAVSDLLGDVAGAPYDPESREFAVIARPLD